jgi:5-methylcytosine-specific restriction endonuclease McrA
MRWTEIPRIDRVCKPNGRCKRRAKDLLFCDRPWVECHYCGTRLTREQATLDHIKPWSAGGSNRISNFLIACGPCNRKRGTMPYQKYIKRIAA